MSEEAAVRVLAGPKEIAAEAAAEVLASATEAVGARGVFSVALSGGSTPRDLYQRLADPAGRAAGQVPWDRTLVFFGDERHVPPDHPDSNYRMAREALLAQVPLPAGNIHRIRGELPAAAEAAAGYEREMRAALPDPPVFDLVLLGLGEDGHTASLFPGSPALEEEEHWVAAPWVERFGAFRITLTFPVLNRARAVLFLVAGSSKAEALRRALRGNSNPLIPAARVRPRHGRLLWLVDGAAAAGLGAD